MADVRDPARDQAAPIPGKGDVQRILIAAMEERRDYGVKKYGQPVMSFNGRSALQDAWEEALDLLVYLTQARLEAGETI
jgi:hypothetical protein